MKDYDRKRIKAADRTYAAHVLRSIDASNPNCYAWTIGRPDGGSEFWAQIIVGHRGSVIVTGDGPDLIFRFWRRTDWQAQALDVLRNVATSSADYLASKLVAGASHEVDLDVAADELRSYAESEIAERDDDERVQFWRGMSAKARRAMESEYERESTLREIYEFTGDCEVPQFGRVVSDGVIRASAACRKLLALIEGGGG